MVRRVQPEGGTVPYYFTYTVVYADGRRVSQYDERGRVWQLSRTSDGVFEGVAAVEVFVHPAFVTGAPPIRLPLKGRLDVEYTCRQHLTSNVVPYRKQRIVVRCAELGWTAYGVPDDFDAPGDDQVGWTYEVVLDARDGA